MACFPAKVRPEIDRLWENDGRIPAEQARDLGERMGVEIGSLMMQLLPVAQAYAVVPVSHYAVGAVAAGLPRPGASWCSLYLGANFEFSRAALSFTVHAEQCATNNAWLSGEEGLLALAISAAPCGYCRQFLYELVRAEELSILLPSDPKNPLAYSMAPLPEFLPQAFGPGDLGIKGGLMDPRLGRHPLRLDGGAPENPLVSAALAAAEASYAPYPTDTEFQFSGVAVQTEDGAIYPGRYAENAAYNPSLSPLESALAFMNMVRPPAASRAITRCVLVEVPTLASQLSATLAVLAAYAPGVTLEYFTARAATRGKRRARK